MAYNLQVGHIANGDLQIVLGMSPIPFFQQDVEEKDGIRRAVHRAFPETQVWVGAHSPKTARKNKSENATFAYAITNSQKIIYTLEKDYTCNSLN